MEVEHAASLPQLAATVGVCYAESSKQLPLMILHGQCLGFGLMVKSECMQRSMKGHMKKVVTNTLFLLAGLFLKNGQTEHKVGRGLRKGFVVKGKDIGWCVSTSELLVQCLRFLTADHSQSDLERDLWRGGVSVF